MLRIQNNNGPSLLYPVIIFLTPALSNSPTNSNHHDILPVFFFFVPVIRKPKYLFTILQWPILTHTTIVFPAIRLTQVNIHVKWTHFVRTRTGTFSGRENLYVCNGRRVYDA